MRQQNVASLAEAWIEILIEEIAEDYRDAVASLAEAWIEIFCFVGRSEISSVASLAEAWIEIAISPAISV